MSLMSAIAIIGSGVVGQATGKTLAEEEHDVLFIDVDDSKISTLKEQGYQAGKPKDLSGRTIDIFFITVPTPTPSPQEGVDLKYIEEAAWMLGKGPLRYLNNYPIIVVKSTVPPGTTRKVVTPLLERSSGKKSGVHFGVAMEPEYLREKAAFEDAHAPHLVIIGTEDERAMHVMADLRMILRRPIVKVKLEEAEIQKYIHNLWNATKISFFNEMRLITKALDIEEKNDRIFTLAMETTEATWNHRYGTRDFGAFGGACLPKDTAAFLKWSNDEFSIQMPLLKAVITVNENVKAAQAHKTQTRTEKKSFLSSFKISGERRTLARPTIQESFSF